MDQDFTRSRKSVSKQKDVFKQVSKETSTIITREFVYIFRLPQKGPI